MKLEKEFYRTGEVAKMLGVAITTVSYWCKIGKVKAIKTAGGHYRIPREEVERLLGGGWNEETKN